MHYHVIKGINHYIALAKEEPFTRENPDPIREPGELWFEFGDTPEQALERLNASLMTKPKTSYKRWRWRRHIPEGDDIEFHILPLLFVHREQGQWTIWIGWLKWIFAGELIKGYAINYLGFGNE